MPAPKVQEGEAPFDGYKTWYRVTGDLKAAKKPLVVLHGGPGASHDYVDSIKAIAEQGRAVVHYDQLGCGKSTHLPDRGVDFWTVELFLRELENLLDHLGIREAYHVLGQSWGGMLGAEHGVTQPRGLRSLIISDSPASMELWVQEANKLRDALPPAVQATLLEHEAAGTTSSPEYQEAMKVFYDRHVCRVVPNPPEVLRSFAQIAEDPTVYFTMNGPSEFHVVGSLKHWSIIDRVQRIKVPTFLISGRYDEATPAVVQPFADGIKDVRWQVFEHSSHMPHVEEKELYMKSVGAFLDQYD
ncbi:MAG TPA: proline iminopeptidase-family hydrolase [Dongiaceae bacterium]|nr:proline iminopeptidase-family hydrolase [Dongiaceae bacterium]